MPCIITSIVEVGREQESSQGDGPQQTVRIASANPLGNKIEAAVVAQNLYNGHRSHQEHHDGCCLAHIFQEDVVVDEELHRLTGCLASVKPFHIVVGIELHDEVFTPTNVENPSDGANEHGNGGLVDTCQMACCYQQIAEHEKKNN